MQKWGERIFSNQQFGSKSLNQDSNGNRIRKSNTAILKYLVVNTFRQRGVYCIYSTASQATSPDGVYILRDFHKFVK
jgi:hypothetical protein